jgi:hypothetical protein
MKYTTLSTAKRLVLAAAVIGAVLFAGCHSPFATHNTSSSAKGAMKVSFQAKSAKTVVADLSATVYRYSVVLHCTSASTSDLSGTLLASQASEGLSFSSILPGTWNVSVVATDESSTQIGVGSVEGQSITAGGSTGVTVPISGTKSGTGNFIFTFEWPQASADSVSATLYDSSEAEVGYFGLAISDIGDGISQATVIDAGIASGTYRLQLTFKKSGVTSGVFGEAVNVWDNVTSNLWLDSSGACHSMRTFAASEFSSHDASLKGLYVTVGGTAIKIPLLSSSSNGYILAWSSATLTPFQSVDGQMIECSTSGGESWTTVASGSATPALGVDSTMLIRVTATDGTTQKLCRITLNVPGGLTRVSNPGVYTFTFANSATITAKAWGAGGGNYYSYGGGGGYAYSTFSVAAGQTMVAVVGQGGGYASTPPSGVPATGGLGYGSGGGASLVALFDGTTYTLEACGGGGGGGSGNSGGVGGGNVGGSEAYGMGTGGSNGVGGNGGSGINGSDMSLTTTDFANWGGYGAHTLAGYGGGGGGGYGGGGAPANADCMYGGDGGGGYGTTLEAGSGSTAGNTGDSDYLSGVGNGATDNYGTGGNGEVLLTFN